MSWSEQELADVLARRGKGIHPPKPLPDADQSLDIPLRNASFDYDGLPCEVAPLPKKINTRGVRPRGQHKTGEMNKTEAAYAEYLGRLEAIKEILWWSFEKVVFHLAPRCTYRPDFMVMTADGIIELHETKGFMEDDAAVKIKVCGEQFPFPIYVLKFLKGNWEKKQW